MACRAAAAKLPWFIPLRVLAEKGYIVDPNELADEAALLSCFGNQDAPLAPERRLPWHQMVLRRLEDLDCTSAVGLKHWKRLVQDARTTLADCEAEIAYARIVRRRCNRAIAFLTAIAALELVVIFGRMSY